MAVVYGLLYLLFTTITGVFISSYGWSPEICGLAYMGVGLGFFLSLALVCFPPALLPTQPLKPNLTSFDITGRPYLRRNRSPHDQSQQRCLRTRNASPYHGVLCLFHSYHIFLVWMDCQVSRTRMFPFSLLPMSPTNHFPLHLNPPSKLANL